MVKKYITYDPSYNYEDDAEDMQDEEGENDNEGWSDEDIDDDQDCDEDTAWKVRKNTIKIMEALVKSCPEKIREKWTEYVKMLSDRFIERTDHVKEDILASF